ncbi:hypothetical protein IE53DRAFT_412180 [Violaceomyces palustris]|uniref:Uncharacterized protein n=1 Tax=Violaceomyces palustris TaxID=1673888 RepID=A0ACD0NS36_9BASI|nr:hypothetical protein IE53DRAFT_412180 [Violaceomyces palustris]
MATNLSCDPLPSITATTSTTRQSIPTTSDRLLLTPELRPRDWNLEEDSPSSPDDLRCHIKSRQSQSPCVRTLVSRLKRNQAEEVQWTSDGNFAQVEFEQGQQDPGFIKQSEKMVVKKSSSDDDSLRDQVRDKAIKAAGKKRKKEVDEVEEEENTETKKNDKSKGPKRFTEFGREVLTWANHRFILTRAHSTKEEDAVIRNVQTTDRQKRIRSSSKDYIMEQVRISDLMKNLPGRASSSVQARVKYLVYGKPSKAQKE